MAKFKKFHYQQAYFQIEGHYCGKSLRAQIDEHNGWCNISNIDKEFVNRINEYIAPQKISIKKVKELIKRNVVKSDVWHHTGKYGMRTTYYHPVQFINFLGNNKQLNIKEL